MYELFLIKSFLIYNNNKIAKQVECHLIMIQKKSKPQIHVTVTLHLIALEGKMEAKTRQYFTCPL